MKLHLISESYMIFHIENFLLYVVTVKSKSTREIKSPTHRKYVTKKNLHGMSFRMFDLECSQNSAV